MQKFENVKLRSVRNIFAVMLNQNPREGERYFSQLTNATQAWGIVGIDGEMRQKTAVHCKKYIN